MNFGAEPLDAVSCCDWTFVKKVRVILRVCWLGDNELVFLLLSGAIVRLFHSTCNSLVVPSSPPPCWHKPLLAELRSGTATMAPQNKKVGRGWGWVLRWCRVPHCPCALFDLRVFLAVSVLRSTPAFAGLSRGHCDEVHASSRNTCVVRLFAHVSDLTCLTVLLLSSSVGAPFHFIWFILHS